MIIYIIIDNNIWFIPLYLFISPLFRWYFNHLCGSKSPARLLGDAFICLAGPWDLPWLPHGESHVKWNTQTCHLRGTPGLSHVWGLELRIQWKMNVATLNQKWGISNLSDKLMWTFCKEKSTHLQTYHCDRCASHNLTHILTNVWSIFGKMS